MGLLSTGVSTKHYYKAFNKAYLENFGRYYMLHYPMYKKEEESLFTSQENLTEHCIHKVLPLSDKEVLEIGCGNGVQALYIYEHYRPKAVIGVDLNEDNIRIAKEEKRRRGVIEAVTYFVGDAQDLAPIQDNSIDVVINIESAFHYPDKERFIHELYRVLKPGGKFVIADILLGGKFKIRNNLYRKKMKFHHWSLAYYMNAFSKTGLSLIEAEDITSQVAKGFTTSIRWFKRHPESLKKITVRIWAYIMLVLNRWLLNHMRKYYVFVGRKANE